MSDGLIDGAGGQVREECGGFAFDEARRTRHEGGG
jgi:hypothetical protein